MRKTLEDWKDAYYEQQALHTEATGMLGQERDNWKRKYESACRDADAATRGLKADVAALREALQEIVRGDVPYGTYSGSQCLEIAHAALAGSPPPSDCGGFDPLHTAKGLIQLAYSAAGKIEVERSRGAGYNHAEVNWLLEAHDALRVWLLKTKAGVGVGSDYHKAIRDLAAEWPAMYEEIKARNERDYQAAIAREQPHARGHAPKEAP